MEKSPSDFPPLTPGREKLLKKIKAKLQEPAPEDIKGLIKLHEEIDRFLIRMARSGLVRRVPGGGGFSGFFMRFEEIKGQKDLCHLVIEPGGIEFHPGLPAWAKKAFINWVLRGMRSRETLRKARIGLEKGLEEPVRLELPLKILELRGIKEEDAPFVEEEGPTESAIEDDPSLSSVTEILEKWRSSRVVTDEWLKSQKKQRKARAKKRKTRTRKELRPWHWVIRKLVEGGLLKREISHQALKKMLKANYPEIDWTLV